MQGGVLMRSEAVKSNKDQRSTGELPSNADVQDAQDDLLALVGQELLNVVH